MLINFPFQKPNISGIPSSAQEIELANDLLYTLLGLPGCHIILGETALSKPKISEQFHSSLRDIAYEILPMSNYYRCINSFRLKASSSNCGQVLQALAAALQGVAEDYNVSLF